jgi:D-3-phosphoglycerate dehydrogenase
VIGTFLFGGNHPLLKMDRALCTPHSAWIEKDMFELYFGGAFDNVVRFARGEDCNIVNPEALKH